MTGERDEPFGNVGEDLVRAGLAWADGLSRAARDLSQAASAAEGVSDDERDGGSGIAELMMVAARAHLAFAVAGFDYSRRLLDLQARRAPQIGESLVAALGDRGLSDAERRALVDEARGYMREVATVTMDEARYLTRTLAEIDRGLAAAAAETGDPSPAAETPPVRRWRAKE